METRPNRDVGSAERVAPVRQDPSPDATPPIPVRVCEREPAFEQPPMDGDPVIRDESDAVLWIARGAPLFDSRDPHAFLVSGSRSVVSIETMAPERLGDFPIPPSLRRSEGQVSLHARRR
jgi:hypothetical protein